MRKCCQVSSQERWVGVAPRRRRRLGQHEKLLPFPSREGGGDGGRQEFFFLKDAFECLADLVVQMKEHPLNFSQELTDQNRH